jgi:hypothetical protein
MQVFTEQLVSSNQITCQLFSHFSLPSLSSFTLQKVSIFLTYDVGRKEYKVFTLIAFTTSKPAESESTTF